LLCDSRIRIHTSDKWIRIRIQEARQHTDPTDPDPQHCLMGRLAVPFLSNSPARRGNLSLLVMNRHEETNHQTINIYVSLYTQAAKPQKLPTTKRMFPLRKVEIKTKAIDVPERTLNYQMIDLCVCMEAKKGEG
jgi:hypothetical protein